MALKLYSSIVSYSPLDGSGDSVIVVVLADTKVYKVRMKPDAYTPRMLYFRREEPLAVELDLNESEVSNHVFICAGCSQQYTIVSDDDLDCFFVGLCYRCITNFGVASDEIKNALLPLMKERIKL